MRKSSRLVSVVFSHLALLSGLVALPTVGQGAALTVLNWIPPNSFVPPPTNPPTPPPIPPTTLDSLNTDGLLVSGSKASGTIAMWLCSITATTHPLCSTSSFAMVGKDPSVQGSGTTSIDVRIVPLLFSSDSLKFDPENKDACSPNSTPALNMVQQSPLFKPGSWSGYLKPVGASQFGSLFQRANFWKYTQPKALNPNLPNSGKFAGNREAHDRNRCECRADHSALHHKGTGADRRHGEKPYHVVQPARRDRGQ
jgi:hypothetical protein